MASATGIHAVRFTLQRFKDSRRLDIPRVFNPKPGIRDDPSFISLPLEDDTFSTRLSALFKVPMCSRFPSGPA